jgi:AcrR family transcriptional regulator
LGYDDDVPDLDAATALKIADRLPSATGRARRADGVRNALRLIIAAQQVVDDLGVEANSHEIARRAGVGVGTFYRQVGSLPDLLAAILTGLLDQIMEAGQESLADPDPWRGFTSFAASFVQLGNASCGVKDAIRGQQVLDLSPAIETIRTLITRLVERAQQAGVLRSDVDWLDVACLLASVVPPGETLGEKNRENQWRRNLDIVVAGLRA